MIRFGFALFSLAALAACMPNDPIETEEPAAAMPPEECNAAAGESFIGQEVTDALGPQLLEATGARTLRVTHKNAPVTMDFRPDRLTVAHDDDRLIVRLSCG